MSYEVLGKQEYARRCEFIGSDIDFLVKRTCRMTPNQALAIIEATRHCGEQSSVVNGLSKKEAMDAYRVSVLHLVEHGSQGRRMDPDKPMPARVWEIVRNVLVDCLGMEDWFQKEESDGLHDAAE